MTCFCLFNISYLLFIHICHVVISHMKFRVQLNRLLKSSDRILMFFLFQIGICYRVVYSILLLLQLIKHTQRLIIIFMSDIHFLSIVIHYSQTIIKIIVKDFMFFDFLIDLFIRPVQLCKISLQFSHRQLVISIIFNCFNLPVYCLL